MTINTLQSYQSNSFLINSKCHKTAVNRVFKFFKIFLILYKEKMSQVIKILQKKITIQK